MWDGHKTWEEAEKAWDRGAEIAAKDSPIKGLLKLPNMVAMTDETAKNLMWKSFKWMIAKDTGFKLLKKFLKHPFKYGYNLATSLLSKQSFSRDGDFFLYGVKGVDDFCEKIKKNNSLLVVGFSYCHKPLECPSGRFTDACIHDENNPVCRQCFIGKCVHALPNNTVPLLIPTIHYIGEKILTIVQQNPDKEVSFLITACEMTLTMFGDLGHMVGIKGIGVRLDGRICNTMKAFELSELGIKPGLTVVLKPTQDRLLKLLQHLRN